MEWLPILGWMSTGLVLGVLSGFMGVGGGVVLTPLLLYLGMPPAAASVTSLAFIIPTAWAGMMRGKDAIDVPLTILLTVGAVIGTYAIGRPLVEQYNMNPALYKRLFGAVLLIVALDMVGGFTEALKHRTASAPRGPSVAVHAGVSAPAAAPQPQEGLAESELSAPVASAH